MTSDLTIIPASSLDLLFKGVPPRFIKFLLNEQASPSTILYHAPVIAVSLCIRFIGLRVLVAHDLTIYPFKKTVNRTIHY